MPVRHASRLLALCLASPFALAADWYVATTGTDANPGTSAAQAFATVGRAVQAVRPGDAVWVAPGTYRPAASISIWEKAGSAASPILISGLPGQPRPVLDCSAFAGSAANNGIYIGGSSVTTTFVTIRRLAIRNAGAHGIASQNARDLLIEDCEIGNCQFNGVYAASARVTVRRNWLHDNCAFNYPARSDGLWGQGIGLPGAVDGVVEANLVERNRGEGIDLYAGATGCRVAANVVLDAFSCGIYLDRARHSVVERNFVRAADPAYFRSGAPANGLVQADEAFADDPARANLDTVWRSNIVAGSGSGFSYGAYTGDGSVPIGLRSCRVVGNTLVGSASAALQIGSAAGHSGNRFAGNLFAQAAGYTFSYVQAQNDYAPVAGVLAFDHDAWWDAAVVRHGAIGGAVVTADPLLADPSGAAPWGQRPGSGSPLIDAGATLADLGDDFEGRPRGIGAGTDIGAFEATGPGIAEVALPLPAGATSAGRVFTTWDWGDGTPAYTAIGLGSGHRYASGGTFVLTATVWDPEHATATGFSRTIVADPPAGGTGTGTSASASGGGCGAGAAMGLLLGASLRWQRRRPGD